MHFTAPPHGLGVRLHQKQPQPQVPIGAAVRAVGAVKRLEYMRKHVRGYSSTVIMHTQFQLTVGQAHFLQEVRGRQKPSLVLRVDKNGIRATLVSLEARTGLKVQYQDEEARKAGKG